jgi:DNA-binding transcriptional ArsR family regulator
MTSPELLEEFSHVFRLLSEPARLQLLCTLKQGPCDVAGLMEATGFSQSHISRQLVQLQRAGLVSCERDGVRLLYQT